MKICNSEFNIIVPLMFDSCDFTKLCSVMDKETITRKEMEKLEEPKRNYDSEFWFRHCFQPQKLSPSRELQGSPILDEKNEGYIIRFELSQVKRQEIGLHNNERTRYLLEKDGIPFQIRKVRLWALRVGIAFLTIEVWGNELGEKEVLNLSYSLNSVNIEKIISYERRDPVNGIKKITTNLKDIIEKFWKLQKYVPFYPVPDETLKHTNCLFYGVTSVKDKEHFKMFLEMFRMGQRGNRKLAKGISHENWYHFYTYINWSIGKKMLAAVGDLTEGGDENKQFLQDPGGLKAKIQENYLPLYVYYLGIWFYMKRLKRECEEAERKNSSANKDKLIQELVNLRKIPLKDLISEEHIRVLFEEYVSQNILKLDELMKILTGDFLPVLIETRSCDVFISYRRKNGFYPAMLIYKLLKEKGKNPFLDMKTLRSGEYKEYIYRYIEKCEAVVVILTEGCLEPRKEEDVWIEEIEKATQEKKKRQLKIIPIMIDDFEFPNSIPDTIELHKENAVHFTPDGFDGSFLRLCSFIDE